VSFSVKKDGKNKGRLFYTCQQEEPNRCGFFLWREEAINRESAAVLANSRTEPYISEPPIIKTETPQRQVAGRPETPITQTRRARTPDSRPTLPPRVGGGPLVLPDDTPSKSSKSFLTTSRGGDTTSFELTSDDERALLQADKNVTSAGPVNRRVKFETPSKRKHGETVASGSLPTPETHGKRQMTSANRGGSVTRIREADSLNELLDLVSPQTTPTPGRFKDALGEDGDLWATLNVILTDENVAVGERARQRLEEACAMHARKNKGILQGRNILRKALNAREQRIKLLEAELDTEREVIKCLRDKP
jgi:hypothetical protein